LQQRVNYVAGSGAFSVTVADLNLDGIADIIVANNYDGTLSLFLGKGDGAFQSKTDIQSSVENPRSVAVADLNGDGKPDLAVAGENRTIAILLGSGSGAFQNPVKYTLNLRMGSQAIAVVDSNGDGKPDLALADASGSVTVIPGNGNGTFQVPASHGTT